MSANEANIRLKREKKNLIEGHQKFYKSPNQQPASSLESSATPKAQKVIILIRWDQD